MNDQRRRIEAAAVKLLGDRPVPELSVRDLAAAAGLARGTVYANLGSTVGLLEDLAARLAAEMNDRIDAQLAGITDPAERIASGVCAILRRAHDEPAWGRFLVRHAFAAPALHALWDGPPARDLARGIAEGRFAVAADQLPSLVAALGGAVLAAMFLVLEGHRAWRDAAADTGALLLRGLGVPADEARALADDAAGRAR